MTAPLKGYDDVPGSEPQPVGPESFIESEESLVLPRLHHSVQGSFVHGASRQDSLVHHPGPDHVHGVGGQRPRQATRETRTVHRTRHGTGLVDRSEAEELWNMMTSDLKKRLK